MPTLRPSRFGLAAAAVTLMAIFLIAAALLATSSSARDGGPHASKAMCSAQATPPGGCVMRPGR